MQPTTNFEFGDVVLVGFPFTNLKTTKKRPAVVISSSAYQAYRPDLVIMAITSRIRDPLSYGEALIEGWEQAGLLKPSVMKPLIATVEQSIILKRMGFLNTNDQVQLKSVLHGILELNNK
ncbi:MAG: Growth inhibitor [Marinobacter excellens HL-55]|uniref:Growth inhibitor n=1 Tax=Marinobacter excellens HL-55 TaxID=1305731 RepID=A0A0P8CY58_9GAMM|nr:MAG: Growth inhibitor [Marinobacter excellens HL-55]